MLQKLPQEVLLLIIKLLPDRRDLKQLCETSKALHGFAIPELYATITIQAENEAYLEALSVKRLMVAGIDPAGHLQYVRNLRVRSRFHDNLQKRCVHHRDTYEINIGLEEGEASGFRELSTDIMPLLTQLEDESLRGFSWEMGICVPHEILGITGYLKSKQSSIEVIALTTSGRCDVNRDGRHPIDLSGFKDLRKISWTGIQSVEDFNTLRSALKNNAVRLEQLQLDFVNWSPLEDEENPTNFFASKILDVLSGQSEVMFPALKVLSLKAVSLEYAEKGLACALNLGKLSSLTLHHCAGSEGFLAAVVASGQTISLSSLEIVYGPSDPDYAMLPTLLESLQWLKGLRDLFVSLPGPDLTLNFWRNVADNLPRLVRFVYHQRVVDVDEDSLSFEEQMDLMDLSLLCVDRVRLIRSGSDHPFARLPLECLGLGCAPLILKPIVMPFATSQTLKILHIRRSGSDMAGPLKTRAHTFLGQGVDSDTGSPESGIDADNLAIGRPNLERFGYFGNKLRAYRLSAECAPGISDSHDLLRDLDIDEISRLPGALFGFALWAFRLDGLPSLQVLAFGDFSYNNRFRFYNHLFCRHAWSFRMPDTNKEIALTFRPVRDTDRELWSLIDSNRDFLESCPAEPIVAD